MRLENCSKIKFSLNHSFSIYQIKKIQEQMCLKSLFYIYIPCFKSVASIIKRSSKNAGVPLTALVTAAATLHCCAYAYRSLSRA